jgi:hypothetical protein
MLFLLHVVLVGLVASFETDLDTIGSNRLTPNVIAFSGEVGAGSLQKKRFHRRKAAAVFRIHWNGASFSPWRAPVPQFTARPRDRRDRSNAQPQDERCVGAKLEMSRADVVVFRDHRQEGESA